MHLLYQHLVHLSISERQENHQITMAQYTHIQEHEIKSITRRYGLELISFGPIEEGSGNSSYLVQTFQGKYILTIFEIGLARVQNLCRLLLWLEEYDFPTTRLQAAVSGKRITQYAAKPVIVKPYISGQVIKDLDEDMIRQIGAAMAGLSMIPAPGYLPDSHAYGLQTFPDIIGHKIDPEYETWLANRHATIKQNIPEELPHGMIHGDIFFDNVLFEGKELKAIIDFEEACNYHKVFDLGMGIVGLCVDETKIVFPKVKALVKGYQQIRELEKCEVETLQLFVEYAATATSSWRFWKYNLDTLIPEKSDSHRKMVEIARNVSDISKNSFLEAVFNSG